jgi:hypothetical protein
LADKDRLRLELSKLQALLRGEQERYALALREKESREADSITTLEQEVVVAQYDCKFP